MQKIYRNTQVIKKYFEPPYWSYVRVPFVQSNLIVWYSSCIYRTERDHLTNPKPAYNAYLEIESVKVHQGRQIQLI